MYKDEKIPAVSASASIAKDGKTHISLVNIDPKSEQSLTLDLADKKYSTISGSLLTSKKLRDFNSFERPDYIKPEAFNGAQIKGNQIALKLPPFSVVVLTLE